MLPKKVKYPGNGKMDEAEKSNPKKRTPKAAEGWGNLVPRLPGNPRVIRSVSGNALGRSLGIRTGEPGGERSEQSRSFP